MPYVMPNAPVMHTDLSSGPQHSPASGPTSGSTGGASHLFLREEQIRAAQDMLFFAYRDFTGATDPILEQMGLGRAHHRVLYFVGRQPGISVSALLSILRIAKQSLARVMTDLTTRGLIEHSPGRNDRRQRLLRLTPAGETLERQLFECQREILAAAYRESGGAAVEGFRRVMRAIMSPQARAQMDNTST